jgi:hypothetical protein
MESTQLGAIERERAIYQYHRIQCALGRERSVGTQSTDEATEGSGLVSSMDKKYPSHSTAFGLESTQNSIEWLFEAAT